MALSHMPSLGGFPHVDEYMTSPAENPFMSSLESMSISEASSLRNTPVPFPAHTAYYHHDPYTHTSLPPMPTSGCMCHDCLSMSSTFSAPSASAYQGTVASMPPLTYPLPPTALPQLPGVSGVASLYPTLSQADLEALTTQFAQRIERLSQSLQAANSTPASGIPHVPLVESPPQQMQVGMPREGCESSDLSGMEAEELTHEQLRKMIGKLNCLARTPKGSSTIQAAIASADMEKYDIIYKELRPHFLTLLTDANGAYVMRSLMDTMHNVQVQQEVLGPLNANPAIIFDLCIASLHSRRVIQYFVERFLPNDFSVFIDLCVTRCFEISTSQHGCISIQRILDKASPEQRAAVFHHLMPFVPSLAAHPYGNYVIQYIVEHGGRDVTDQVVMMYLVGHITELSCNKFASNVIEKCMYFASPVVQHIIIEELYSNKSPQQLEAMMQDSFGNYIVQATIALASFQDVWLISEQLKPVLAHTPYGHKIEARLQRRLKGKKVALRS